MKETARMLLALLVGSGLFLTLFFLLHWNPIVSLLLSVGNYFGLFFLLKPRPKLAGISLDGVKNGEDWAALLEGAQEDLETLERAGQEIPSPSVAKQAQELSATARRLMAYLQKNREKIPQARRFFLYYLDTAAKLLERYKELETTGLHTQEVLEIQQKTQEVLPVLNQAFEKQFTQLMAGELLDAEVDIQVLQQILEEDPRKEAAK